PLPSISRPARSSVFIYPPARGVVARPGRRQSTVPSARAEPTSTPRASTRTASGSAASTARAVGRPRERPSPGTLARAVDVDQSLIVETALELCRRPSMRPNERAVAHYLGERLDRLGFDVELQEVVADRPNVVAVARGDPGRQSFLFN